MAAALDLDLEADFHTLALLNRRVATFSKASSSLPFSCTWGCQAASDLTQGKPDAAKRERTSFHEPRTVTRTSAKREIMIIPSDVTAPVHCANIDMDTCGGAGVLFWQYV
eukprot:CAMPEP_0195103604 /NCGR_PEP_ID=MMETSP0448-20130528/72613_1 /TAXON_ID=66468 /ORGANISM="Heterocapsa triquestra, Strain CCMP 448" /LENGTH=109 /DNA_ID=CAMNT_0040139319 /DNA_START=607 /DNA_END=937 /DNA_ORIENTATION=-